MQGYTGEIRFAAINSPHLVFILGHAQPNSSQVQYFLLMSLEVTNETLEAGDG